MRTFLLTIGLMATAASPALAQNNASAFAPAKPAVQKQAEAQLAAQRQDIRANKKADDEKADQERAKVRDAKI